MPKARLLSATGSRNGWTAGASFQHGKTHRLVRPLSRAHGLQAPGASPQKGPWPGPPPFRVIRKLPSGSIAASSIVFGRSNLITIW